MKRRQPVSRVQRWWHQMVTFCCPGQAARTAWHGGPAGRRSVVFDEAHIERDQQERGVVYGTQTIEETPTPFLLYDSQMSRAEQAIVEVGENHRRTTVDISDLQQRL